MDDRKLFDTGSHMLKHLLEYHHQEDFDTIKFGMKVVRYHRTAYVRQIHESVAIQNERQKHIILNSKSEFNRCALPRLTLQLGENDYRKEREREKEEREREEEVEREIRELKKMSVKGRRDEDNMETKPTKI